MTTLVQDFQALLSALAPAGGVWYGVNTNEPPAYPYIVWMRVASTPNVALGGPSDLQNTRVQIDIYSHSVSESQSIESTLEAALAAAGITNAPLLSLDQVDPDTRAFRITKDYSLWARN